MLNHFPILYPGELLYSACARLGDRMQYPTAGGLMTELFGRRHGVPAIDLPHQIEHLISIMPPGHNYTADYLIEKHTLFPLFATFAPVKNAERIRENMRQAGTRATILMAGIAAGRVTPPTYLRTCPCCDAENIEKYGETYWHRMHQIAGVEVCPFHDVFLQDTNVRRIDPLKRHMFVHAQRAHRSLRIQSLDLSNPQHKCLQDIARVALNVVDQANPAQGLQPLVRRYHKCLNDLGYITLGGMLRYGRLRADFVDRFSSRLLKLLQCSIREKQQSWLKDMFSTKDRLIAPLRHILLLVFLRRSAQSFFQIDATTPVHEVLRTVPCFNRICPSFTKDVPMALTRKHCKQRCVIYIIHRCPDCGQTSTRRDEGRTLKRVIEFGPLWEEALRSGWEDLKLSVTQVAKQLGTTNATVVKHAAKANLQIPRIRPGKNSVKAFKSKPRKSIAKYTVEGQRERWMRLRDANPDKNAKRLTALSPALCNWLFRRDRDWYVANVPRLPRPAAHAVVDWNQRDEILGARVLMAAAKIKAEIGKPRRVTIAAIGRELREKKNLRVNLARLPLTRLAIQGVIENNEQFSLRRISYVLQQLLAKPTKVNRCNFIRLAGLRDERMRLPSIREAVDNALVHVGSDPLFGNRGRTAATI